MNSTNKIVFFNVLSMILVNGIAFISAPIFTRMLGTENYGIVSICTTWIGIAVTIFGLEVNGAYPPGKVKFPIEQQAGFRSSVLALATVSFALGSCIIIVFHPIFIKLLKLDFALVVLILMQAYAQMCVKIQNVIYSLDFKAKENFILALTVSVGTTVASIVLIGLFDKTNNYYGRMIGLCSAYVAVAIFACVKIFSEGKVFYNREYWKYAIGIGLPYVFHGLSSNILGQSDRVMLQRMVDESAVGIYSLASTFGAILNTVMYAFTNSWVPFFFDDMKEGRQPIIKRRSDNCIELFSVLTIGFILLTPEVFSIIADKDFRSGCSFVPILAMGHFMDFMYIFPANHEMYYGRSDIVAKATTFAAVINIALNFVLISILGTLGAVYATAISHFALFAFHYISARRIHSDEFAFRISQFILPTVVIAVVCVFCSVIEMDLIIVRWLIAILVGLFELYRIYKRKAIF